MKLYRQSFVVERPVPVAAFAVAALVVDGLSVAGRIHSVFVIGKTYQTFEDACRMRWPGAPGPHTEN